MASGRSSRNVLERFGVVAVRLGRHEGTLGLGGGRPAAFWSVLERLDGIFNAILKRGGPLGSPRRNTWLRGRASRSVLKRFEAFGLHFRSWRSRDRRSHQGPAAQHIESRGPAPAGPCGAPAGAGGTAIRRQAALGTECTEYKKRLTLHRVWLGVAERFGVPRRTGRELEVHPGVAGLLERALHELAPVLLGGGVTRLAQNCGGVRQRTISQPWVGSLGDHE